MTTGRPGDEGEGEAGTNRLSPEARYQRDPTFRQLVDTLEVFIHQAQYTPTELREAAILAATRYEIYHVRKSWHFESGE